MTTMSAGAGIRNRMGRLGVVVGYSGGLDVRVRYDDGTRDTWVHRQNLEATGLVRDLEVPTVRRGQVWADNDRRSEGRKVRILRVEEAEAVVIVLTARTDASDGERQRAVGAEHRIRLNRFRPTSTGYRLVEDVPADV